MNKAQLTIRQNLESEGFQVQLGKVLPQHIGPDRMIRMVVSALTRTPKLAECTQESFFRCVLELGSWGLEPNGRSAHLIPYGRECTIVLDYKGMVELAYRSGYVKSIHADVVYDGDIFEFNLGKITKHTPYDFMPPGLRPEGKGEMIAAYCVVEMKDGACKHEIMSKQEIEKVRLNSKAGKSGPWKEWYNEMAKKTVFRRASKWLPLSPEIIDAFENDHDRFEDIRNSSKAVASSVADVFQSAPVGNPETGELFEQPAEQTTAPEDT